LQTLDFNSLGKLFFDNHMIHIIKFQITLVDVDVGVDDVIGKQTIDAMTLPDDGSEVSMTLVFGKKVSNNYQILMILLPPEKFIFVENCDGKHMH